MELPQMGEDEVLEGVLITPDCLKLLELEDHPLAHKRLGDATRADLKMAAKLHEQAAAAAMRRARLFKRAAARQEADRR
jgi:hypothetical protein